MAFKNAVHAWWEKQRQKAAERRMERFVQRKAFFRQFKRGFKVKNIIRVIITYAYLVLWLIVVMVPIMWLVTAAFTDVGVYRIEDDYYVPLSAEDIGVGGEYFEQPRAASDVISADGITAPVVLSAADVLAPGDFYQVTRKAGDIISLDGLTAPKVLTINDVISTGTVPGSFFETEREIDDIIRYQLTDDDLKTGGAFYGSGKNEDDIVYIVLTAENLPTYAGYLEAGDIVNGLMLTGVSSDYVIIGDLVLGTNGRYIQCTLAHLDAPGDFYGIPAEIGDIVKYSLTKNDVKSGGDWYQSGYKTGKVVYVTLTADNLANCGRAYEAGDILGGLMLTAPTTENLATGDLCFTIGQVRYSLTNQGALGEVVDTYLGAQSGINEFGWFPLIPDFSEYSINNYKFLMTYDDEPRFSFVAAFTRTLGVAVLNTALVVICSSLTGFAFSRYHFKGKKAALLTLLTLQMFPAFMGMVAILGIFETFDWRDNWVALTMIYVAGAIPYNTFIVRGYMRNVSKSLDEAAAIDGASNAQILFKIIIPLAVPIMGFIAVNAFMSPWLDYILPSIVMNSKPTVGVILYAYIGGSVSSLVKNPVVFMAGALLLAVPIMLVQIYMQKYIVFGLTAGGDKG